jgi:hypothetical protein
MTSTIMRITFISLSLFILLMSTPSYSVAERRIALVIGNGSYDFGHLKNSVNDANDIADSLKKLGFSVILKNDSGHKEMEIAIKELGKRLKKDDVGLFFYAGHGVQIEGQNYLIPIGANIEEESDVKYRAVNLSRILEVMDSTGNRLNIIILDACRNNPYAKSFRSTSRGLAIVEKSPKDTLIAYSTSPNQVAIDGSGRNSPYTKALLDNMSIPGIPIEQVFKKVRNSLDKTTGGKQIPWYISSLGGDFYFNAEQTKKPKEVSQITEDKRRLEVEGKTIEEESSEYADKKKQLAKENRPKDLISIDSALFGHEPDRFITYSNGTVLDTRTNLMWAAKDNNAGITWQGAKEYCENYRGGGYTDWRMPTQDELATLYDARINGMQGCSLTRMIELTKCSTWALESSSGAFFRFDGGTPEWNRRPFNFLSFRALPVRSGK